MSARPTRLKQVWAHLTPFQRSQVLSEEYAWERKNGRRANVDQRLWFAERILARASTVHEPLGSEGGNNAIKS
jgi:hypothetical protein